MDRKKNQFQVHKEKSISVYAMVGLDQYRISADQTEVLYKRRWRKIRRDGVGDTYVENGRCRIWMEIKTY